MIKNLIKSTSGLFFINGTIGVLPIILCMILSEFIPEAMAIYASFAAGLFFSLLVYFLIGLGGSLLLLSASTSLLLLLGITTFVPTIGIPQGMLPFYAEIGTIIFSSVILYEKRKIKKLFLKKDSLHYDENLMSSIDSGAIYSRLIQILCIPHFIITSLIIIFGSPLGRTTELILLHILPPAILIIAIITSQIGLALLLSLSSKIEKVPILNDKGEIIDKKYSFETYYYKNQYINPVIRIAVISKGMLFLSRRSEKVSFNPSKIDLPMECYLRYEENLEEGVNRIMRRKFPQEAELEPRFSIKYRFKNKDTNRLIYLYILYVDDDSLLYSPRFRDGKLWTFQQIETNLEKNFFGECFENEYDQLKQAALISEEFKKVP
ncbi:hypothetical protein [uncultured Bacteroides sp.]|uniref:hypothetical protein n=1 Tax=uncultured Bacteroides sp. TaxID=162156 RepID=UPI002AA91A3E|nr:hypothetical protein [uncultured Bacteroides sp.]